MDKIDRIKTGNIRLKRVSGDLAYRKRYLRLTANEQVEIERLKRLTVLIQIKLKQINISKRRKFDLLSLQTIVSTQYFRVLMEDGAPLERPIRLNRTIDSFSDSNCNIFFRFLKEYLRELLRLLRFPAVIRFDNRSKMTGEEVFLRGLYELCSDESKHKISNNVFERDWTAQSRAFTKFIDHIYDNFHQLVHYNLAWWYI